MSDDDTLDSPEQRVAHGLLAGLYDRSAEARIRLVSRRWEPKPLRWLTRMAAFLFLICGVLRLARFNCQTGLVRSKGFIGLPTPAAAGFIATLVIFTDDIFAVERIHPFILVFVVFLLAFLMVSNIKYENFKSVDLREKKPFSILVFVVLAIYIIATIPQIMLFFLACVYVSSGLVGSFFPWKKFKKEVAKEAEDAGVQP